MRVWKILGFVLILSMVVLSGCGPQATLIRKPAAEMNLTVENLGSGYSLSQEQGLEELKTSWSLPNDPDLNDANYRLFETENGVVLAVVITMKKPATADTLKDLTGGFEEGFSTQLPGTTLNEVRTAAIGEESIMRGADLSELGLGMYFLGFRQVNVVGVLAVIGKADFATVDLTTQLGQKMAAKMK